MNNLNGWIGNALFLMALAPFCFMGASVTKWQYM